MYNALGSLIRQLPAPIRYPMAFFIAFVVPAPIFAQAIALGRMNAMRLPFPANVFVWVYGGGLQHWSADMVHWLAEVVRTVGQLALVAAVVLPVAFALLTLWWFYGPGAMNRRKQARRELWLDAHARQIHDKRIRTHYEKAIKVGVAINDRDAYEREVKRWD